MRVVHVTAKIGGSVDFRIEADDSEPVASLANRIELAASEAIQDGMRRGTVEYAPVIQFVKVTDGFGRPVS